MSKPIQPTKDNAACEKMIQGSFQGVLCMADGDEPYALPINHAYRDGKFYFHCAPTGRKLDVIHRNPKVSYVINRYYGAPENMQKSLRCHGFWESVIAYGTARVLSEREELIAAFKTFMAYYGQADFQPSESACETTRIIVIEVDHMTARREYEETKTEYWAWEKAL
jgi:nitroimidazol reductase NimA-like FMN-containing flavoprotein (pyridoxamine 5'-phosphate oxidase superfamily)